VAPSPLMPLAKSARMPVPEGVVTRITIANIGGYGELKTANIFALMIENIGVEKWMDYDRIRSSNGRRARAADIEPRDSYRAG